MISSAFYPAGLLLPPDQISLPYRSRQFFAAAVLLLMTTLCTVGLAQSTDGSVPPEVSCVGDCPSIGTVWTEGQQAVCPVTNDCVGTPLRLLLGQLGVVIQLAQDQCPLWILIQPPRGVPAAKEGCCILTEVVLPELQQVLECECTRWFIICWDQDCRPVGTPRRTGEVVSYIASPCPGQQPAGPCNEGLD